MKSDPAVLPKGSPPPDPVTMGVAGTTAWRLKPLRPGKLVWTSKGMPVMTTFPTTVLAVTARRGGQHESKDFCESTHHSWYP